MHESRDKYNLIIAQDFSVMDTFSALFFLFLLVYYLYTPRHNMLASMPEGNVLSF